MAKDLPNPPMRAAWHPSGASYKEEQALVDEWKYQLVEYLREQHTFVGFRAYHSTTQTSNLWTALSFDTESYDVGGNFASSAYTIPEDGYYSFGARATTATSGIRGIISLYVDTGTGYAEAYRGTDITLPSASNINGNVVSIEDYFNSGDKVRVYFYTPASETIAAGSHVCYFHGHLISRS